MATPRSPIRAFARFSRIGGLAITLFCHLSIAAALTPVQLRCESQDGPFAIDGTHARLSWELASPNRAEQQYAYQVLIDSSAADLARNQGNLWDSGRIESSAQEVPFNIQALAAHTVCHWKVRVWDRDGRVGPWSRAARWTLALMQTSDWKAQWIGSATVATNALPLFRREFRVTKPVQRALVHVTGLGHYQLLLDGRRVGDRFLDPAWSVYEKTIYYATYDLTALLKPGPHAFAVMLGKGFYNTVGDRRVHGVHADRPLKLLLQAHLIHADGTESIVLTDDTWRTAPGPITHSAILGGEDFDARRWPSGWDRPGFDDASWSAATILPRSQAALVSAFSPPMVQRETFAPVRIDEPEPGVFVYDFGQNASAIPRLRVRGTAGQVLRLTPAEQRLGMQPRRNDGRGLVNPAGVGRPNYFQYTLRGGAPESWEPRFTYTGFQYLQLDGAVPRGHANPRQLPVVEELTLVHVRNASATIGRFKCSEPLFNRIDRMIDWAVRANLSHVLTDCPHREKLGWLEVAYLMGPSIAGRYDIGSFYRKVARDIDDSQRDNGLIPTVAPAYPAFEGGFDYTPEWGAAGVVVPWQIYQWTGDDTVLRQRFACMKSFVDSMKRSAQDLVPVAGLGDWYDYGHGKPVGASQFTPVSLSAMATFQRCARIVADTAGVLGSPEAAYYRALADDITKAFNQRWFDGTNAYQNSGSPQAANSMALVLGLVPSGKESAALQAVIDDIRRRGNQQTAGDIGHWYLIQALAQAGRHDVLYDLTIRTNLGSYGFIVNNGWTSMPEAWDADTGASMNHCMLGHIQEWFLGHVAGIRPDPEDPGFGRFFIAPQPVGALTWARGEHRSVRGLIRSEWKRQGTLFHLQATIPPNTIATIFLPTHDPASIREGGRRPRTATGEEYPAIATGRGWRLMKYANGVATLEAGGGSYAFTARFH